MVNTITNAPLIRTIIKKFTILFFGVVFVALITCSVQSVAADHLEPGDGIYKDKGEVELVTTKGSKYQVYLQSVIRNVDGQLITVTDNMWNAKYLPNKITDDVFDTLMGEKEIVTIDDIKYEKVQYTYTPTSLSRFKMLFPIFSEVTLEFEVTKDDLANLHKITKTHGVWKLHYCAAFKGHGYDCVPILQVLIPMMILEGDDVVTQQWTILRILN